MKFHGTMVDGARHTAGASQYVLALMRDMSRAIATAAATIAPKAHAKYARLGTLLPDPRDATFRVYKTHPFFRGARSGR
jgi:hypothetical protein